MIKSGVLHRADAGLVRQQGPPPAQPHRATGPSTPHCTGSRSPRRTGTRQPNSNGGSLIVYATLRTDLVPGVETDAA